MRLRHLGYVLIGIGLSFCGYTSEQDLDLRPASRRPSPQPPALRLISSTPTHDASKEYMDYFCDLAYFREDIMSFSRLIKPLTTNLNLDLHNDGLVNTIAENITEMPDFDQKYPLLKGFMIQGSAGPAMCITTKMNIKKQALLVQCQHILAARLVIDSMETRLSQHKPVIEELSASIEATLRVVDSDYNEYKKNIPWAREVEPDHVLEAVQNYKDALQKLSPKSPRSFAKSISGLLMKMVPHKKAGKF